MVDQSGRGDWRTIGDAVAMAEPGKRTLIWVRPGTYKESLVIRNDVRIVGEGGRSKVIVEGAPGANVFTFTAGSATLTGMTIRYTGPKDPEGGIGAISVQAGTPVIEDCDLTSSAGPAVYIHGAGANPTIRNCTIRNSRGSGVAVYDQGQGTIEKCVISGNAFSGVAIKTGGNPVIRDCEIRDGKGSGVWVFEQGQGTIERCVISGNAKSGVEITTGGNPTVRDCEIRGNGYEGVWVYEQGQGTFTGNTLTGNGRGAWDIEANAGRVTRTGNRPNG